MKYRLLFFLCFIELLVSCENEVQLSFSVENFSEKTLKNCKDVTCPEITIHYIEAIGNTGISEKINSKIKHFIINALYLGDEEQPPKAIT